MRYIANPAVGDSFVNITNTGASSIAAFPTQNGNICANVYTFTLDEQLLTCCSCLITPSGLASLSARRDLLGATSGLSPPNSFIIKLLATTGINGTCNPATVAVAEKNLPVAGMLAWGTTLHALPVTAGSPAGTYFGSETAFSPATLSLSELQRMVTLCAFGQIYGSGFNICGACRLGALGGASSTN